MHIRCCSQWPWFNRHKARLSRGADGAVEVHGGMSIELDGGADYLNCGSSASIDDIFAGGGSYAGWFYAHGFGANNIGNLYGQGSNNTISLRNTGGDFVTTLYLYIDFNTTDGYWRLDDSPINLNEWMHIVVAYDSDSEDNDPTFYLNGVLAAATELGNPDGTFVSAAGSDVILGQFGGDFYFDGEWADKRLLTRMIAAAEAALLAAGYRGPLGGEVMWLDMEGVEAEAVVTVLDKTINKNHGSPQNGLIYKASKAPRYG